MSAALATPVTEIAAAPSVLDELGLTALVPGLTFPARKWLVDGLWPERGLGFIGGLPKAYKSWLGTDLAVALCTGKDFLGRHVESSGPVLFFLGEVDKREAITRADRLLAGRGLAREDLEHRLYFSDLGLSLEDKKAREQMVRAVEETRASMVFIDPFARFLRDADENNASQMRSVNNFLRQDLNRGSEVGVCVVHHTIKAGDDLRGTGDIRAVSEVTLLVTKRGKNGAEVSVEMREARPPDDFCVQLVDGEDGSLRFETDEIAAGADRVQKARELLSGTAERVTLDFASKALGVRRSDVKSLLEQAGGAPSGPKGSWLLGHGEVRMAS